MIRISSSSTPPFYSCSEEWIYPVELQPTPRHFYFDDLEDEVERANRRCEDLSLQISKIKRLYEKHTRQQESVRVDKSYHEVPNFIPLEEVEEEAKVEAQLHTPSHLTMMTHHSKVASAQQVGGSGVRVEEEVGGGEVWRKPAGRRALYVQPVGPRLPRTQPAHQFNFRSIPFVAGMSTSGSHNLGLKIQETLSLIKMTKTGQQAQLQCCHSSPGGEWVEREWSGAEEPSVEERPDKDQLRAVLLHLHHEYKDYLREYEEARARVRSAEDAERLVALEARLDAKEKVINVISSLYKQVVWLRERARARPCSQAGPSVHYSSSVKLTRLLRRIDRFQQELRI